MVCKPRPESEAGESVPNNVGATLITFTEDVKKDEIKIVVQGFVVQEQLCQVAEVLAVHLLLLAIHLKHADTAIAVDLLAWRMLQLTFG